MGKKISMKKYKINKGFQLLAKIFLFFFTKRFKITADISDEIKNIDEPYILLSNHVGFWDPFVVSNFIKKYPHFVSSDAVMKDPIKRFFLERYKIIPKRKNMRDTQVIRTLLEYIKNGEAVALFPEATRTWTGNTLHIDDSIGKLIKLLNVPVITVKMQGMFLFNPRWAYSTRNAAVNIVYKLMADKEKLSRLSSQEITVLLKADLEHSESEYQKNAQVKIRSNKRAEYLNHVLFYCPNCKSFHGFEAKKNTITCKKCNFKITVDKYNILHAMNDKTLPYNNIEDAFRFQSQIFTNHIRKQIADKNKQAIFSENDMLIYQSINDSDFKLLGKATLSFYLDKINILFNNQSEKNINLNEILTLDPQLKERIELNTAYEMYRFIGEKPGISGIKWEIATNVVWQNTNQAFKQSSYFKNILNINQI